MGEKPDRVGPWSGASRPEEQEAVVTTIVGGRPPGSGQPIGPVPRGIEVLVKKAAVDPEFKAVLLGQRAEAAGAIGLALDPAEAMMLRAVPAAQLEAIIARTEVAQEHRRAFLGSAAAVMLAALGLATPGCGGIRPDQPSPPPAPTGTRPDVPTKAESPPPPPRGIRPDVPEKADRPASQGSQKEG
jgi:hypothetical protein